MVQKVCRSKSFGKRASTGWIAAVFARSPRGQVGSFWRPNFILIFVLLFFERLPD